MSLTSIIAGVPAYEISFTNPDGYKGMLFVAINKGSPYTISYLSTPDKFDKYLLAVEKMISTLKFI